MIESVRIELAETAMARSNVYGFLAALFREEPNQALVEAIKTPEFSTTLLSIGLALGDDFYQTPDVQLIEDLAVEYTRLFIGPGHHLSAHESVQVEVDDQAESCLWGPETVAVKRFVEATGLSYDETFGGMPDHISAEFELMQKLAERECHAWQTGDADDASGIYEIYNQFLQEHIIRWVPIFCDKVIAESQLSFYREIGSVTKSFIIFEHQNYLDQKNRIA